MLLEFSTQLTKKQGSAIRRPNAQLNKVMKKLITSVFGVFFTTLACLALQPAGQPVIEVFGVLGPAQNQPGFAAFAEGVVQQVYTNGQPTGALEYRIHATNLMQNSADTDSNVWFVVKVSSSNMFSADQIDFKQKSSDTGNAFAQSVLFTNSSYIYNLRCLGVIHGPGGPRSSDSLVTSGSLTNKVNECIFIGVMTRFQRYTNDAHRTTILGQFNSIPNFYTTGTWQLKSNNVVLQRASKSLRTQSFPTPAVLSVSRAGSINWVGINCDADDTYYLESRVTLSSPWIRRGIVNSGDIFEESNIGMDFYRARLQ